MSKTKSCKQIKCLLLQFYTFRKKEKTGEITQKGSIAISLQSGASSPAKHGGAYFSAVYGFMKDPIAAPGPYENQEV